MSSTDWDKKDIWENFRQGCTNEWTCPKCKLKHISHTPKAGTKEIINGQEVRYIAGPCACGMGKCSECDYEAEWLKIKSTVRYKDYPLYFNKKTLEDYQI